MQGRWTWREKRIEGSPRPQTFYLAHVECLKIILTSQRSSMKVKFSRFSWEMEYSGTLDLYYFLVKMT